MTPTNDSVEANAFRIPVLTNSLVIAGTTGLYAFLLWQASHMPLSLWIAPIALLFGLNMIPVYSLIHEAEHGLLYQNKTVNYVFGIHLCNLFIAPFTFFKHCHLNHHKHNRTDVEMWDLYYEGQNRYLRHGNLYLMMVGIGYLMLPLSVVLSAIHPSLLYYRLFTIHTEMKGFLEGIKKPGKLSRIQWESWLAIAFQVGVFFALDLKLLPTLALFLVHGFVWSSQNYVNHAFAPRDILNGAHNHTMSVWFKYLYLNFNVHLAHHQNPKIPWVHLPRFIRVGPNRISFLRAYWNLWKGPRLTREPSPAREIEQ
jgi:fatty acid desaturase